MKTISRTAAAAMEITSEPPKAEEFAPELRPLCCPKTSDKLTSANFY